jgi:glucose-6-phosphate dehydrogenase assembly protein OpcA
MLQAPSTRDEAREVPLGQIEATLAQLGREASLHNGGQMAARSSVMTLVAYARGTEQGARVGRAIEGLTGQHPSRSIILMADPDEPTAPLTASVAMHCHVPHFGAGQTCSEQIKVHARGETAHHLAGVVLPLLLTELPVFVWWTDGMRSVSDLMQNLVDISDRVIVDSADFREPRPDFLRLAEMMQHGANRTAFSDFNWSRVRPWRELVAQFFDAPRLRPYLDGVQRVEIEYAVAQGERPNPAQANLFAGWLASRLRWQALTAMHTPSGASTVGLRTSLGAPVTMEIEPRFGVTTRDWWAMSSAEWPMLARDGDAECVDYDAEGQPVAEPCVGVGALMRVSLQTRLNGKSATFTVVREDDLKNATTVVVAEGESMPQRRTPLTPLSETSLLHAQLGQFGRDPVFDAAVQAAYPLVLPSPTKGRIKR